jgi:hypothetical protein
VPWDVALADVLAPLAGAVGADGVTTGLGASIGVMATSMTLP